MDDKPHGRGKSFLIKYQACTFGKTERSTKESGEKANSTAKASRLFLTGQYLMGIGMKVDLKAWECASIQMVLNTQDSGGTGSHMEKE